MIPELSYLKLLLFSILSLVLVYSAGHTILSLFNKSEEKSFLTDFQKLLTGLLFFIVIYSTVNSKLFTINTGFLFLIFYFILYIKIHIKWRFSIKSYRKQLCIIPWKNLLVYAGLIAVFFTFHFFKLYDPFSNNYFTTHSDNYCYAIIIENLNLTGIEGVQNNLSLLHEPRRTVYHFGELWFAAFISKFFGVKSVFALLLIVWPMAYLLYCLGIAAVFQFISVKQKMKQLFFSMAVLFVSGLSFFIPKDTIFTRGDWFDFGISYQIKIIFCVSLLLLAVNFLIRRNYFLFTLTMLALPLLSTPTAPAVYISVGIFTLYLWRQKAIPVKTVVYLLLLIMLTFVFLIGYISLISKTNSVKASAIPINTALISFSFDYLRTAFNCLAGQSIKFVLQNLFYFAIAIWLLKNKRMKPFNSVFIFMLVLNFSGIISYSIFHRLADSVQFWVVLYVPICAVSGMILLYLFVKDAPKINTFIAAGILALCIFQNRNFIFFREPVIDSTFAKNVSAMYNKQQKKKVVSLHGKEDFSSIYTISIDILYPSAFLKLYLDDYNPVSLSSFIIPVNKSLPLIADIEEEVIRNTVFYKYALKNNAIGNEDSISACQIKFIKEYDAGFIVLTPTANIFPELNAMITNIIEDKEGYKFCALKY